MQISKYFYVILALAVATNLRFVKKTERHAVFKSNVFYKLVGPGLVFIPPSAPSTKRFKILVGHRLEVISASRVGFKSKKGVLHMPFLSAEELQVGDKVQVTGFDGNRVVCELVADEVSEDHEENSEA